MEDGETKTTRVTTDGTEIQVVGPKNPSRRRDAIVISFWCEGCENKPRLAIIQHKGQTFAEWQEY